DGYARRARVHDPGVGGRGPVRVPRRVGGAHLERVAAVAQAGVALGAGTGGEAAAVELALERRATFARRELEGRVGVVVRIGRRDVDRRVRSGQVHRPRDLGGRCIGVPGRVDGAHLEGVAAFGKRGVAL